MRVSLEAALALTVARGQACQVGIETVPVQEAAGRVLREDVVFPNELPPFSYAQMDGYALCTQEGPGSRLRVEGESRAGRPEFSTTRAAIAISTGAMTPPQTHAVVPWEHVERVQDTITLKQPVQPGQFIRRAGDDARAGDPVASSGTRLELTHIPALAVAERASVAVARRPTVALFLTGDELRAPGAPDTLGSIVDTNGPMLVALLRSVGAHIVGVHHVADIEGALEPLLLDCTADVLITVGGAAEGNHDHVASALAHIGAAWVFRGVAIKPGKPVGLAERGASTLIALPGNPGSALVTAMLFVLPLLAAMEGEDAAGPHFTPAIASTPLACADDRIVIHYGAVRGVDGLARFQAAKGAASGSVAGLLTAQSLAFVPIGAAVPAGGVVPTLRIAR